MKKWEKFSKEEIEQFAKESFSYAQLAKRCDYKCTDGGSSLETIRQMIETLNLDVSHFTGQGWLKGRTYESTRYIPFEEYIKGEHIQTSKLCKKLIKDGLKEHICECCLNTTWNGKPIPLEVHHKDGNRSNNSFDNLQLLCPNCHAMTDNWRGRGKKDVKDSVMILDEDLINALQNSENIRQALLKVGLSPKGGNYDRAKALCKKYNIIFNKNDICSNKNYCKDCGKKINNKSIRCKECENKFRKKEAIDNYPVNKEELKQLIRTTSFLQIGKRFGVSDNAIRKWCRNLNLPYRVSDIKKMSDEEWELV